MADVSGVEGPGTAWLVQVGCCGAGCGAQYPPRQGSVPGPGGASMTGRDLPQRADCPTRGADIDRPGYSADDVALLRIARRYFHSFAEPASHGWIGAMATSPGRLGDGRGPAVAVATPGVIQTLHRTRRQPIAPSLRRHRARQDVQSGLWTAGSPWMPVAIPGIHGGTDHARPGTPPVHPETIPFRTSPSSPATRYSSRSPG